MIKYNETNKIFTIETKNTSYIFGISDFLQHLYWGKKVCPDDCTEMLKTNHHSGFDRNVNTEKSEFAFFTGEAYVESCLKIDFKNTRKLDMKMDSYKIEEKAENIDILEIVFKNSFTDLYVTLIYTVYNDFDVIGKHAVIVNNDEDVTIENIKSGAINIPELEDYRIKYTVGKWIGEFQLKEMNLQVGKFIMESRRGSTGPHYNPSCVIDDGKSSENHGNVWYTLLGYSGNWKMSVEKTIFNNLNIVTGINDFDFLYKLKKKESFTTPIVYQGFSSNGYGEMSRKLHDFQRKHILPKNKLSKVLYNSWEATAFNVTSAEQMKLATKASQMGIELFVVDDGWFGERHSDKAGLGDWYVNENKFPNGLNELITHVNKLNMDFGIWVEPEAVNPDSDLYRKHPDWIYQFENMEPLQARNQYVLNISKPEVKKFILDFMHKLLTENPKIAFIKWDMNRSITDMSMGNTEKDKELWHKHCESLYDIWEELTKKYPYVEFETCSGGGGRIDLGILRYADDCWPSDNTNPYERLYIQNGFSYFYNPKIMMCWVTDDHGENKYKKPADYKFHSSMQGSLGIGANINKFDDETFNIYKENIELYKKIRQTIQFGDMHRLAPPKDGGISAVSYINKNKNEIVVFAFLHGQMFGDKYPNIKLNGLEDNAVYTVTIGENSKKISGSTLMNIGLELNLKGDFDSTCVILTK